MGHYTNIFMVITQYFYGHHTKYIYGYFTNLFYEYHANKLYERKKHRITYIIINFNIYKICPFGGIYIVILFFMICSNGLFMLKIFLWIIAHRYFMDNYAKYIFDNHAKVIWKNKTE